MKGSAFACAVIACYAGFALADPAGEALTPSQQGLLGLKPGQAVRVEEVAFANPKLSAVKVVRGGRIGPDALRKKDGSQMPAETSKTVSDRPPEGSMRAETVSFGHPAKPAVTVLRGPTRQNFAPELFAPAFLGELDRVAFAVEAAESRHGADPGMWRSGLSGPQGPMQVSLAAAIDAGGGDRFDLGENRKLGRVYLSQMFERYGNWADALAAYNWGPGNLDKWIAAGRPENGFPPDVVRYIERVLRDSLLSGWR